MEEVQLSLFGKMFQELSPPTKEKTSALCLKSSAKLKTVTPLFLDARTKKENVFGLTQDLSWEMNIPSDGECSMLNFGAYPKDVEESLLSQILEVNAPEKYYLSVKACQGILRRAAERGKELPPILKEALEQQIERLSASENAADVRGGKGCLTQTEQTGALATSNDQFLCCVENHPQDGRCTDTGELCQSLNSHMGTGGNNVPLAVFGISPYHSNCMLSDNPHSGIYEAETSRTLDLNGGNPSCNQGGMVVLEGNGQRPSHKGDGYSESETQYTLNSTEVHGVAYGIGRDAFNSGKNAEYGMSIDEETQPTLTARGAGGVAIARYPSEEGVIRKS